MALETRVGLQAGGLFLSIVVAAFAGCSSRPEFVNGAGGSGGRSPSGTSGPSSLQLVSGLGGAPSTTWGGGTGGSASTCGNGVREGVEPCDGQDLAGVTCASALQVPGSTGTITCLSNCTFDTSQCHLGNGGTGGAGGTSGSACGDGVKGGVEKCDKLDLGGATCASATGNPASTGQLACFANCTFDGSACSLGTDSGGTGTSSSGGTGGAAGSGTTLVSPFPGCGDNVKSGGEFCDGADFGTTTCATALGDPGVTGTLACAANCTLNLSGCSKPSSSGPSTIKVVCGDGLKDGIEACDGADLGLVTCASVLGIAGSTGTLSCFSNCTLDARGCVAATSGTDGGTSGTDGGTSGTDGGTSGTDGGTGSTTCVPITCLGHTYECGDCIDNDHDGLVDMNDPDCLGPCDNNESGYSTGIPGGNNSPCKQDCYFDPNSGSGDDGCYWDHQCDPNEVSPSYYPEGQVCTYDLNANIPGYTATGTGTMCAQAYASQSAMCGSFCGPITPNGCDCFGCCQIPDQTTGTLHTVWLGSMDASGNGTCDLGHVSNPAFCHPCEQVPGCLKSCGHCQLCLGKTTLPSDCVPTGGGVCGDMARNGVEQCDGVDFGSATCASVTGDARSTGQLTCFGNCTINASGCSVPPPPAPFCGDLVREGLEQCDGLDLGGATCVSVIGNVNAIGTLSCYANCTLNESQCEVTYVPPPTDAGGTTTGVCGDGIKNGTDQCDATDFGGATCASLTGNPASIGTLSCQANCTINASNCSTPIPPAPVCGNGILEGAEQCDKTAFNAGTCASILGNTAATGSLACNLNCTFDTAGCTFPTGGGTCGGQICPSGSQACGLSCQPACPAGQYCLTGCCVSSPK